MDSGEGMVGVEYSFGFTPAGAGCVRPWVGCAVEVCGVVLRVV